MTFAERIEIATQSAHKVSAPFMPSIVEVENEIQPVIIDLLAMPRPDAWDYIVSSFSHVGYQALAVRMFAKQTA
jgi:hypothetical protein